MEIKDLRKTEYWHNVELAYSPDLPEDIAATTVGWLGEIVPQEGEMPLEMVKALEYAVAHCYVDQGMPGAHTCEICGGHSDRGEALVAVNGNNYVMPRMILHYIQAHRYLPPAKFLRDLDHWWATLKV